MYLKRARKQWGSDTGRRRASRKGGVLFAKLKSGQWIRIGYYAGKGRRFSR